MCITGPRTLIINNLEYDHADIFPDLAAIQTQFHHLMRTVPGNGLIVAPGVDEHVHEVIADGLLDAYGARFGHGPRIKSTAARGQRRAVARQSNGTARAPTSTCSWVNEDNLGTVRWSQLGEHNMMNGSRLSPQQTRGRNPGAGHRLRTQ